MSNRRSNLLLWIVVGGGALLFLVLCLLSLALFFSGGAPGGLSFSTNQVAVLDIEGILYDSSELLQQLRDYGRRISVKAVVLRINSPGGGVAASQEMHAIVKKFRLDTGKKVVVSMSSVAASGGYYVACAADRIFANPGSITGSIGVIAEWFNYGDLLRWAKVEDITIKSGELKDAGSPTRPLTEAEMAYFQGLINGMHEQFVAAVAASRNMDTEAVRRLADGRVYTGQEAKHHGLIDDLGTFQDALAAAAEMAGISGEPKVVTPPKEQISILDLLFGNSKSLLSLNLDRSESQIRFQYLWR